LIKDFDDRVSATQPLVFVFVALIAFVMLLVSIRSVVLALKGVLMTVLSVAAAYGSLVAVFQWGWLEQLGFAKISSLDSTIPPLVLAMTFGLSMDYEIFLLTRIRERFLQTNSTRDAVAYGVSTSARTITSAALIMIAVFIGFAFAGMPLVAQLGVACAVAIAVDATVVRLVLVPALMAMFDEWNWWLPRWLDRVLPEVDFEKPLPKVEVTDLVIIPDNICALGPSGSDLRTMLRTAARMKHLAPQTITVADPLAFSGCTRPSTRLSAQRATKSRPGRPGLHPVTMWRGRLSVAVDALQTEADTDRAPVERRGPVETTNVQLPTGDRLQIPTGAETLRLAGYLIMCRNATKDYAEFAELVDLMETQTAALVLAGMDRYYCGQDPRNRWVATQLVRRLADPQPSDEHDVRMSGPDAAEDWAKVRQRCLSVAVAMLEEAK
jgi:RND superfamily putative drug exporter